MAEGMEKGMMEGMEAGRMETAKKLFALGLEPEVIRKATALSQEVIAKLQRESHGAI
jgi:predicted transposase YdaD